MLFVDVDNLKEVNDREGHARGDALLIAVARALQAQLRTSDLCARAGGDEFLVVLPETDASEASVVAERIRTAASALDRGTAAATVSIGHATAPEAGVAVDELVRAADLAMYVAKRTGRNWVQGYAEEVSLHLIGGDARLGTRT